MIPLPPAFLERPIAHRALHDKAQGRPENSMAAISAAISHGYGIEIDVQLSADQAAMVFHDYGLERLTGQKGTVQTRARADLAKTPLLGGDDGVPDLLEVLALVDGQVPVLIEIKDQDGAMGPDVGPLERAVATAVDSYGGDVAVMSFNPHSVALMRELLPQTCRGLTTSAYVPGEWPLSIETCARLRDISDFDRVEASFVSHEAADLDRDRLAALKAKGASILCWTVKSAQEEALARRVAQNVTFEGYLP